MTIQDIERIDSNFLTVKQVAEFTESGEQFIRVQAHEDPDALGFPVLVCGTRVKIPKDGFVFGTSTGDRSSSRRTFMRRRQQYEAKDSRRAPLHQVCLPQHD